VATRAQVLIPISIAAVIIGVVGVFSIPSDSKLEAVEFPRGTVKLDDTVLEVQIADTEPRRVRGLMFQEQLPYDEGMLFVFDSPGNHSIWMLNMQFSLDVMWFDENLPPCKTALETMACTGTSPNNDAKYVLEVTSGFVQEYGINNDSKLEIISI